jgi:hypothetical protein
MDGALTKAGHHMGIQTRDCIYSLELLMISAKHVEPSINFGIINSITKLHLVGICTESIK